jgi:hypothetical protein
VKINHLKMHSKFTFWCGVCEQSNFVWSKKAFVFTDFGDICCSGTFPIPAVFKQKLGFVRP